MKTRFADLFQNKTNRETVFNRYNLDKKDRSDLNKIVNDYNNGLGSEDNLPKVEKAFIFDYTKNYLNYQTLIRDVFKSCIVIADMILNKYINFENLIRHTGIIGFTVSSLTCENDYSFTDIKDFLIEVPVEDFYGLSNNNRVYFAKRDLSIDQQVEYITKIINDKFSNLKEGEEIITNGYIIPIPGDNDNFGVVTNIKKINNKYMIKYIQNGIVIDEFKYIDEIL